MNWLFTSSQKSDDKESSSKYIIQEIDEKDESGEAGEKDELDEKPNISSKKKISYNSIRGKTIKKTDRFCTKEITIENLIECFNKEIIIIPEFQRILNMDKIDLMISSYSNDPDYFNYLTNPLQIVRLVEDKTELYFLIDGQHRFFMYKRLYENKKIDELININIINCKNIDDMYEIYKNFNYDNQDIHFNKDEIIDYITAEKYICLRNMLNTFYKKFFKTNDSQIYSLEGFVKILTKLNYLDYFETIKDAVSFLNERNNLFVKNYYDKEFIEIFSKKDADFIRDKKIFSIKNNNFIDFLMIDDEDVPIFKYSHHIFTNAKRKSTSKVISKNI